MEEDRSEATLENRGFPKSEIAERLRGEKLSEGYYFASIHPDG